MVYRYSWLAGLAGLLFAFVGLSSLLLPTVEGPPWQFVIASGIALGIVITWTALTYRLNTWIVAGLNLVAMIIAVSRIAAPATTTVVLPTTATWFELRDQFELAFSIIRNGVEPVIPESGIVVLVMLLFWLVGALLAWGLTTGHAYVAVLPPLVLSLQFATMDRAPTGWTRVAAFIVLVAGTIFAVTRDELDQTAGRMARRGEWPSSRTYLGPAATTLLAATVVTSLGAVVVFDDRVPRDGLLDWRTSTGLTGDFFGSVSYNPFVGIQQRLVSNSTEPVFLARITGDLNPDQVYFRLVTMETYSGGQFYANNPEVFRIEDLPWEAPRHAFAGEVGTIRTDIQIERLRMDWLPAAYSPVEVDSTNSVEKSLRVRREDGSIRLEGGLSFRQMQYSVLSEVPIPDIDVLSTTPNGELSPAFLLAQVQEDAALIPAPYTVEEIVALTRDEPPNVDVYLELPEGPEARISEITVLAEERTKNLETDFEKGLALEAWFHSPQRGDGALLDGFAYTTDIDPGHGATELSLWLLEPTSPNYRRGYCENFATAMAVMARTLGIPSRVVLGFTPGRPTGEQNVFVIQERNAHAWVELWMPTQGWVRFDPTPRNQGDTRQTFETVNDELEFSLTQYLDIPDPEPVTALGGATGTLSDPDFNEFGDIFIGQGGGADTPGGFSIPNWVRIALAFLTVGVLFGGVVPVVKWWRRKRRMHRLHHGDISAAWEEITNRLTDLGHPPQPALTPTEYAADTDTALNPLAVVYSRSLYGPTTNLGPRHVETAQRSLASTTENLARRYTKSQRLLAWYRPGTILPRRLRRNGARK